MNEIVLSGHPHYPEFLILKEKSARGEFRRYDMAVVRRDPLLYEARAAVYLWCIKDPEFEKRIKTLVAINGTILLERLFGPAGTAVRRDWFMVKGKYVAGDDQWIRDVANLTGLLNDHNPPGRSAFTVPEVQRIIEEEIRKHPFDLISIGETMNLWGRRRGHLDGRYPMTKALLQTDLMDQVVNWVFWDLDAVDKEALVKNYERVNGAKPIWDQR